MTVALEIRISDLFPELLADALIIFRPLKPAGAVATGTLQTIPDNLHHLLILIQTNCHIVTPLDTMYI